MSEPQAPTADKKRSWFVRHKVLTALLVLFVLFLLIPSSGDDETEPAASPAGDSTPAATVEPTPEPSETVAPSPTPTPEPEPLTPKQEVQEAVSEAVEGAKIYQWQGGGKTIAVRFPVSDNITTGMIRTGMHNDTLQILKAIAGTDVKVNDVGVQGTFALVDKYGNESRGQVLWSYWDKAWKAIDWSKKDIEYMIEVPDAADVYGAHPDFQE